ncbi:MAG: TraR/DksA C4-type zinc finger protein [Rhodothermales bacterium]
MEATTRSNASRAKTPDAPRGTDLTDEQLAYFRRRILAMRAEIVQQINLVHEQAAGDMERAELELDGHHHIAEVDHDVLSILSTRHLDVLNALDAALERIDDGTYGICRITGKRIPLERLEAMPYADLSAPASARLAASSSH